MRIRLPGSGRVHALAFDGRASRLAVCRGAEAILIDVEHGTPVLTLASARGASVKARRVAMAGSTVCVEFGDPGRGRENEDWAYLEAFDLQGRRRQVVEDDLDGLGINGWALSADGTLIASATEFSSNVRCIELPAGGRDPKPRYGYFDLQHDLRGSRFTMEFSPDGTRLCTSVALKLFDVTDLGRITLPMLATYEDAAGADPNVDFDQIEAPGPRELLGFDENGKRIFFLGSDGSERADYACILGRSPLRLARHRFERPAGRRVAGFDVASRRALWLPEAATDEVTTLDATNGALSYFKLPGELRATCLAAAGGRLAWSDGAELELGVLPPK